MENPFITPNIEEELSFTLISNQNNTIKLKLILNSSEIIFIGEYTNNYLLKKYILKQNLYELTKNIYLRTGENLKGIFQIIKFFISKNNSKIYEEDRIILFFN